MEPSKLLPIPTAYSTVEEYVDALLKFVSESEMIHTLCGGVHILDFLTKEPDHFSTILPQDWREWLTQVPIQTILDLLLREDIPSLIEDSKSGKETLWRGYSVPPDSLLDYVLTIRNLCLDRTFAPNPNTVAKKLSANIANGMRPKKAHEVQNFASYVDSLIDSVAATTNHNISHILDFGSGQNYLGRVLASPLYRRHIIAVESRQHNIDGAMNRDVRTKLAKRDAIWRNKKLFKAEGYDNSEEIKQERAKSNDERANICVTDEAKNENLGRIQYIGKQITDGYLNDVLEQVQVHAFQPGGTNNGISPSNQSDPMRHGPPELMVISLHSCGNLLHHGLRSLILNPTVKAVAMVGCCYNLCTERLGLPSEKLPGLRHHNKRVRDCAMACDPHGFPMSETLVSYPYRGDKGVRMNITARMMAVQAPQNWTEADCDSFFTRHFYRALFQRILVDRGLVPAGGSQEATGDSGGEPVTLGSLRKSCYKSFVAYVRGAMEKLKTLGHAEAIEENIEDITDAEITAYWEHFKHKKHELSIVWSLMAVSAGVVESLTVIDRWLFLREQPMVKKCWVETVFDYSQSPRNLVVVGIKQ